MKTIILTVLVCFSSLLAQDVTYNFDQSANFAKYRTYKWVPLSTNAHPDQLVGSQIRAAIDYQLAQKGLTSTIADNADLNVAYQVSIDKEMQLDTWGGGVVGWGYGSTMTTTTSAINVGTLVIDFFDPAAKKLVWRGQGTKTLDPSHDPQKNQERLQKGVKKILKNFPPNSK